MLFRSVRYAAPVLVFTAEEVWGTRFPDAGSVHLLEWPVLPIGAEATLLLKWVTTREFRSDVMGRIEVLRREKIIGSSLEASIIVEVAKGEPQAFQNIAFSEICIVGASDEKFVEMIDVKKVGEFQIMRPDYSGTLQTVPGKPWIAIAVSRTTHHKCGRCWRHLPEVTTDGALCSRCDQVVRGMDAGV